MKGTRLLLAAVLGSSLGLGTAGALSLDECPLVALVKTSQLVVQGRVIGASSMQRDGQPLLLTSVRVDGVLKGTGAAPEAGITLEGVLGEDGAAYHPEGEAPLSVDDQVILFLTRLEDGETFVTNGVQGTFFVTENETGEQIVRSALGSIPMAEVEPEDRPTEMPLDEFLNYVAKLASYDE